MIIDAHIHMYPPEVAADPVGWARRMDEPYWGALVGDNPTGATIQGWATVDQLIADMDAAGVDRVVLQGIYFRHHRNCVAQNNWYLDWRRQYPDRLSPLRRSSRWPVRRLWMKSGGPWTAVCAVSVKFYLMPRAIPSGMMLSWPWSS